MEISNQVLYKALASVYRMASKDIIRPYMNGVYFEITNNRLTTCAVNGHTLAKWTSPFDIEELKGVSLTCIISLDHVQDLIKALKKEKKLEHTITINIVKEGDLVKHLEVIDPCYSDWHMFVRCVNETFPPYERVIPKYDDKKLTNGLFGVDGYYLLLTQQCFSELVGKSAALTFRVGDGLDPIVVTSDAVDGEPLTIVIMPMRI